MITGTEMIVFLIIGALMAAYWLVIVTDPAWFWIRLMGRQQAMAAHVEQEASEIQQPIFLLGARVLGGIMLVTGLTIAAVAAWVQIPDLQD